MLPSRWQLYAAALAVSLHLAPPAAAGDYWTGVTAFDDGDYATAAAELEPLAQAGDADAQCYLGRIYFDTEREWWDDEKALAWFRRAAAQGQAVAQTNLGLMFELGRGTDADPAEAARWYRRAAEQDRAAAQYNLALLHERGGGVEADDRAAAEWFGRAAAGGHASAQLSLGRAYLEGRGVPLDETTGARWLRKAARQDHAEAQLDLAKCYEAGVGVKQSDDKAARWRRRAAEQGLVYSSTADNAPARSEPSAPSPPSLTASRESATRSDSSTDLPSGSANLEAPAAGRAAPPPGAPPVALPAVLVERLAGAEAGNTDEQYELGRIYELGLEGVSASPTAAQRWYTAAAENGHGLAAYRLAFIYLRGRGAPPRRDYVQAYVWFETASRRNVSDARRWLEEIQDEMSSRELQQAAALVAERNP